jgi:hypothetical protein
MRPTRCSSFERLGFAAGRVDREVLLTALDDIRLEARRQGQVVESDAIADVMDFVAGRCSRHMKL